MPMSLGHDVTCALVDLLAGQPGFRRPTVPGPDAAVVVFDGPEVWLTGEGAARFVVVGDPGDSPEDDEDAVVGDALHTTLSLHRTRDETMTIPVRIVEQMGDPDVRAARAGAYATAAALSAAVRSDPSLGGLVLSAQWSSTSLRQIMTKGAVAILTVTLTYRGRVSA